MYPFDTQYPDIKGPPEDEIIPPPAISLTDEEAAYVEEILNETNPPEIEAENVPDDIEIEPVHPDYVEKEVNEELISLADNSRNEIAGYQAKPPLAGG